GHRLPAKYGDSDVERIELDQSCDPAGPFGSQNGGAAATEGIQDDAVAPAAVANEVGDERHRLHRRMQLELPPAGGMKAVHAGVIEDVRPVAALAAEAKIVDMGGSAVLEDRNQLMLGAIEA